MRLWIPVAILFAVVAPVAAQAPGPASATSAPLPLDLAFDATRIRTLDQPAISPDGRWLAFETHRSPAKAADSDLKGERRFLPNGTPSSSVGLRLHLSRVDDGATRAVCGSTVNCWRASWSPDSARIVYYSDEGGFPQLWMHDVAAGRSRRVSDARIKAKLWPGDEAAWSPDGREVFVPIELPGPAAAAPAKDETAERKRVRVYRSGSEVLQDPAAPPPGSLWSFFLKENNATLTAIDIASGRVRVLVPAETVPRPNNLQLSPDGRWVSYLSVFSTKDVSSSDVFNDLAVVPAAGGPVTVVASDLEMDEYSRYAPGYRWRPGTSQVVFMKRRRLWIVDVGADGPGEPRQLASDLGELHADPFIFTADARAIVVGLPSKGEQLYYTSLPRAIAIVPFEGGAPSVFDVKGLPIRANAHHLWQPVPGVVYLTHQNDATGERSILKLDLAAKATTVVWKGKARLDIVGSEGKKDTLITRYEALDAPADFFAFDASFGAPRRITRVEPRLQGIAAGPAEVFTTTVPGFDGRLLDAQTVVFLPPGGAAGQRLPTLVYLYAGSRLATNIQSFGGGSPASIPVQIFTTRGYAVLLVDVPLGPQGTGGNPIQEMADAVLPQVYHAARLGYTDIARVAIMGQSYGGYSTLAMLTQSNLFRAGMALDGLYDLSGSFSQMTIAGVPNFMWAESGQGRMGTHPWADLKRYLANSPYYLADKIHAPVLLIHGENDNTCPVVEAEHMFNALLRLKKDAQLATYPGEGHVPGEWSHANAVDAATRMVEFLGKYLAAGRQGT